jgi:curved DNA-binding protein CbpA
MRKINDSRKLLGAEPGASLKGLAVLYKGLMKNHHPDKFTDPAEKEAAEATSKHIIDAYHFLVSVHKETHAANAAEYAPTFNASPIATWQYRTQALHLTFADGSEYEFFDVPANLYNKFVNNDANLRFARRHIFGSFPFRRVKKSAPAGE